MLDQKISNNNNKIKEKQDISSGWRFRRQNPLKIVSKVTHGKIGQLKAAILIREPIFSVIVLFGFFVKSSWINLHGLFNAKPILVEEPSLSSRADNTNSLDPF